MNIQKRNALPENISTLDLDNKNRLNYDILSGNISGESLDYLGIIKKSITDKSKGLLINSETLSEKSKIELLEFIDSYNNPAKWKVLEKRNRFHSENLYRGDYIREEITKSLAKYGGSVGYELELWGNGDWLLKTKNDTELERANLGQGYDITDNSFKSIRNLNEKLISLGKFYKEIKYIEIKKRGFSIEKGTITTPPINGYDFEGIETITAQNDFRNLQEFLGNFCKGDNIGADYTYENPISPVRNSDSFIFHIKADLTPFLEINLNAENGRNKIFLIQTVNHDWIALTEEQDIKNKLTV